MKQEMNEYFTFDRLYRVPSSRERQIKISGIWSLGCPTSTMRASELKIRSAIALITNCSPTPRLSM